MSVFSRLGAGPGGSAWSAVMSENAIGTGEGGELSGRARKALIGHAAPRVRGRHPAARALCSLALAAGVAAALILGGSSGSTAAAQGAGGTPLWVAAAAGAHGGHGEVARLELSAGRGRKLSLDAALEGAGSPIGLSVEGHGSRVEYMARGFATSHRLKASFAGFGEVDLTFHPSGKVLRPPSTDSSCPAGSTARPGTFTGRLVFHARGGDPSRSARRIAGSVGSPDTPVEGRRGSPLTCNSPGPLYPVSMRPRGKDGMLLLTAESAIPGGRVALEVTPFLLRKESAEFQSPPGKPLIVAAGVREVLEGVTITGITVGGGPEGKILDVSGGETTLEPWAPFSGSATYSGQGEWAGDLRAQVPGFGTVALTGPGFTVARGG